VSKSEVHLGQVGIRKAKTTEPLLKRRDPETCRQNQRLLDPLGSVRRTPGYGADGDRRIGGASLIRALMWNCGNLSLRCQGRSPSGDHHEASVPMRSTGADQPVRAMKAGNAAGAKGLGQAVVFNVQLATGGDLGAMTNAANCDYSCELQSSVNHQTFERILRHPALRSTDVHVPFSFKDWL
jgi:hypothetical protein